MREASWVAALVCAVGIIACSSKEDVAVSPGGDEAGGGGDPASADGGASDAAVDAKPDRPAPAFLAPSSYADLVVIDARFPFGVTQKHVADDAIAGSHWGRHGGPMVTAGVYGSTGTATPRVIRWTIPADPTAVATSTKLPFAIASGIPSTHFYGADGMIDLPFGPFALLDYTSTGAAFPGEALLYSPTYDQVASRAKVNGFYSGTGITDGAKQVLVYSGLSPLSAAASATNDNGLYVAEVCNGSLTAPPPCAKPKKLFGWSGQSGPVVTDAHGNVFVGASLTGAATRDAVYGFTKVQALAGNAANAVKLAEIDSTGTSSIAAVAPDGAREGWVLGLGFDAASKVYAAAYVEGGSITKGSPLIPAAITKASGAEGLSVFTDDDGDLWLAVTTPTSGVYLELRRKP